MEPPDCWSKLLKARSTQCLAPKQLQPLILGGGDRGAQKEENPCQVHTNAPSGIAASWGAAPSTGRGKGGTRQEVEGAEFSLTPLIGLLSLPCHRLRPRKVRGACRAPAGQAGVELRQAHTLCSTSTCAGREGLPEPLSTSHLRGASEGALQMGMCRPWVQRGSRQGQQGAMPACGHSSLSPYHHLSAQPVLTPVICQSRDAQ